jgi:hypothetical protein
LNRQRNKEYAVISRLAEEARKTGGERKAQEVWESEGFDLKMISDEIDNLLSRYLISKASRRFLPIPSLSEKEGKWERSQFTGKYQLTDEGMRELRGMIRKDTKERMEILSYWSQWVGLLIGIIGAITGLVAVINR